MSGIERIAKERQRQIEEEGFDAAHDDQHVDGSLVGVAVYYATAELGFDLWAAMVWPESWSRSWDKTDKHSPLRQLAIAGALIAAEIDRLERAGAQA